MGRGPSVKSTDYDLCFAIISLNFDAEAVTISIKPAQQE